MYTIYGEEQGEIKSFNTLKEAQLFIKELIKFDRKNKIEDEYYIEGEDENE